jgi:hypothetical protein
MNLMTLPLKGLVTRSRSHKWVRTPACSGSFRAAIIWRRCARTCAPMRHDAGLAVQAAQRFRRFLLS